MNIPKSNGSQNFITAKLGIKEVIECEKLYAQRILIAKLHSSNRKYIEKINNPKHNNEIWERKTAEWQNEQDDIQNQLQALGTTNTAYMLEGIRLMELANRAEELFQKAHKDEKRKIVNLVLSNPKIVNGKLEYSYKKPFNIFVNVTDLTKWREEGKYALKFLRLKSEYL